MPVKIQKFIYRQDCQANPDTIYVFGDNEKRVGKGGQAKEMRGEPNAHGVATKAKSSQEPDSCWSDKTLAKNCRKVLEDFEPLIEALQEGVTVVFPEDGLGTGLSELPTRAPLTLMFIESLIELCKAIK